MKICNITTLLRIVTCLFSWIILVTQAVTAHPFNRSIEPTSSEPALAGRPRYMGVTIFNFETDPRVDDERIEHSASVGCNAVEITINWDRVYPTRTSVANWKVVDSHVQTAQRLGLKIALRIHIGRELSKLGGFWGSNETMQASDGSRMDGGGITQFSYAHQATFELARAFVRETTERYRYLQQQNQLLFMSVVASPALESEYSPVHHKPDGTKYQMAFDYSEHMKQAFRTWLQGRFSIATLNSRWGTTFSDWNAVTPPNCNVNDPYSVFSASQRGKDWYVFRHRLLERFLNDIISTIKGVDSGIKVVNQHGAVWDRLSGLRGTYAFKSLNQTSDGLKFNDGPTYNHRFSMDVVRSNLKPGAFMINAVDGMFHKSVSLDTYYAQVVQCFDHGASMITLANFGGLDARATLSTLVNKVVTAGVLSKPVTEVQTVGAMSYTLSEILKDFYAPITSRWNTQYANGGNKPVQVNLIEDLLDETEPSPSPDSNLAPQLIQPFSDSQAMVGQAYSYSVGEQHFRDSDGTITSVTVAGLPAGLTYNASANLISGTPSGSTTATISVKAIDDDGASVSDTFVLTITATTQPQPAPTPAPAPVVTGNFEGYLDKVECGSIRGWVWDRNKPNMPLTVEFYADGNRIGTTEANIFRSDLLAAGKGNGSHAYSFTTPESLKDNRTHEISAKVLNSMYTLKYAPKSLTCPSSARLAVESAEPSAQGLQVTLLGNPVQDRVVLEVRGAEGRPLRFQITDINGRLVSERQLERAGATEQQQFGVSNQLPGILLMRVTNGLEAVTLKVLKQ